ncbi:MAG: hypothetical protein CL920_09425 [Deltaproteobacteria bacterium]|nr:hypothetical protein [Deltaproteobacteria bacterium]MBU48905.1 hypothetical protein [Deltaproteobacteria bacterium]
MSQDRVRGVLLGLAAGDLNGGPTQMAIRLAESLIEQQAYNIEDVALRYLAWWKEGAVDTGPTTASVMRLLEEGHSLDLATARVHRDTRGRTAGCNTVQRCGPIAMASFLEKEHLIRFAALESSITHWDPLAGEVCKGHVLLCRSLIEGLSWKDALRQAEYGRHFRVASAMRVDPSAKLSKGGFAPDVLKAAIAFVDAADSAASALQAAFDFAGGANYAPVLVGALAGARWGASSFPEEMYQHVVDLPRIQKAADTLAAQW